jgi:hypothetical protein
MKNFKLKITSGIGDCITIRSQLLPLIKAGTQISISIDRSIIEKYRPDDKIEYYNFTYNFLKEIFSEENCKVTHDQSYPFMTSLKLFSLGYHPRIINLQNALCNPINPCNYSYIAISTKVRDLTRNIFDQKKADIFKKINESENKIIILGEKEIIESKEYKIHGSNKIYSIYHDILNLISKEKIVDMTIDKIVTPNIDLIKKDCTLMKFANDNFIFGIGGNLSLCRSVGPTRCYIHDCGPFTPFIKDFEQGNHLTKFIRI